MCIMTLKFLIFSKNLSAELHTHLSNCYLKLTWILTEPLHGLLTELPIHSQATLVIFPLSAQGEFILLGA